MFLEYDPGRNQFTAVQNAPSTTNREAAKMLLLPNGHGLVWVAEPTNALYDLTFDSGAQASWAPTITSFPATVGRNQTVTLTGTQLCGLSECQHFGDDNQQAENYPMVRFIDSSGGVAYARAHNVSTRSIAPGQSGSVLVDVPGSLALGTYSVEAVAMGLPSNRVTVDLVGTLQLFYRGTDKALWSRWRNPDGTWSSEQSLGGQLLANPVAAVVPGTNILQLFYVGTDHGIWSRWRNPDGTWSGEQRLGGNVAPDSLVAATIPGINVLQLFYVGTDDAIWSRWRNPDGTWSGEQRIGGKLPDPYLIAAVVPGTNILQLFYVGTGNAIWSRWRNPNGTWSSPEQRIGGNVAPGGSLVGGIAVVPGTNILQLFYVGTDLAIRSLWRNPDGTWSPEQRIGGKLAGNVIAAVLPD